MATYNYTNFELLAVRLINKFGRAITRRVQTKSGDDWNPTLTNVDTQIMGVVMAYDTKEVDGELIRIDDFRLLTYDTVEVGDKIVYDTVVYEVVRVQTTQPAETKIIHKVQLRK